MQGKNEFELVGKNLSDEERDKVAAEIASRRQEAAMPIEGEPLKSPEELGSSTV